MYVLTRTWLWLAGMESGQDVIRYGVIGAGMMGVEHIENVTALDGAVITAIADTNEESRSAGVRAAGRSVAVFEGHGELIASGVCDAVVVATPNHTHVDVMPELLATDVSPHIDHATLEFEPDPVNLD